MGNTNGNGIFAEFGTQFHAGETAAGWVHFNIVKPVEVHGAKLKVKGTEKASWIQEIHETRDGNSYTRRITHADKRKIFETSVHLTIPISNGVLAAGQFSIPFSFTVPASSPPSMHLSGHDWNCSAYYKLKAVCDVKGLMKSDLKFSRQFQVLSAVPASTVPLDLCDCKTVYKFCCCGNAGQFIVKLQLPKNALTTGERVPLAGEVQNTSTKVVNRMNVDLKRIVRLNVGPGHYDVTTVSHGGFPGLEPGGVAKGLEMSVDVPHSLVPTCRCRIIDVHYLLAFSADVSFAIDPSANAEVTIVSPATPAQAVSGQPVQRPPKWEPQKLEAVAVPAVVGALF